MNREIKISYHWKCTNGSSDEVLPRHEELLEESAMKRILELIPLGFTGGELSDNILSIEDEEDHEGTEYAGWWSLNKINN